jgi:hypothetical protein
MNTVCAPVLTIFNPLIGKSCMPSILIDSKLAAMSDTSGLGGVVANAAEADKNNESSKLVWRRVIKSFRILG